MDSGPAYRSPVVGQNSCHHGSDPALVAFTPARRLTVSATENCGLSAIPADLLAPKDVPAGFDTAWSFLARTEPWAFGLMVDPVRGLVVDDRKARTMLPCRTLPTPDVLRTAGVEDVAVAPAAVWEIVFPVDP